MVTHHIRCGSVLRQRAAWRLGMVIVLLSVSSARADVTVAYRTASPELRFAMEKLTAAFAQVNERVALRDIAQAGVDTDLLILSNDADVDRFREQGVSPAALEGIEPEGFRIQKMASRARVMYCIIARDETGAMYGALDVAETVVNTGSLVGIRDRLCNPRFPFRAVKFNLPWSPYRDGPYADIQLSTCRDLGFWRRFLDMMAENRLNVLSLWNVHPFTYMIRPVNFPKACPFSEQEMDAWRSFWRALFRMAKERGIDTYIVNWNIVVSPEMAQAYGVKERNDTSEMVRRYTRECVTQVINEYEDLTGLGISLADWMQRMTPEERGDWVRDTFIAGIKNARRPVQFIHRSVLVESPEQLRRVIDNAGFQDPVWVEVKFNWSHGHSSPQLLLTHDDRTGKVNANLWTPAPKGFKITWMIRNEDFFVLRWGEPGFIRDHIARNGQEYVGGYFIGSEAYIPGKDFSHTQHVHQTWQYGFEKQWYFYTVWGRLLYDPETPDSCFEAAFERRYGPGTGSLMRQAHTLASRVPRRLATFYAGRTDFSLYSEGFAGAANNGSPLISILELIQHAALDPNYVTIPAYVKALSEKQTFPPDHVTPPQLAGEAEQEAQELLQLVQQLRKFSTLYHSALECEIDDLETWANLGLYFSWKLRAGVAFEEYRRMGRREGQAEAIALLRKAVDCWDRVIAITETHYLTAIPYSGTRPDKHPAGEKVAGAEFSWKLYREQVLRDIDIVQNTQPEQP